jgi:adenylosuccinate lyase
MGQIPKEDAAEIRVAHSPFQKLPISRRTNHDVIAFLENVAGSVGPAALDSSRINFVRYPGHDARRTADRVLQNPAGRCRTVRAAIGKQARRFKMTPMIGRSHGVHAEPITFGLKLALMFDEFGRAEERLTQRRERIRVSK